MSTFLREEEGPTWQQLLEEGKTCLSDAGVTESGLDAWYLLEASFAAREAHPLRAPRTDGMTRTIRECNRARARFRFWEGGGLVFDLCSENASLECEEAVPDGAKRRVALL